jgi:hypothetical protein
MNERSLEIVIRHADGSILVSRELLIRMRSELLSSYDEVDAVVALLRTIQDEFTRYGTDSSEAFSNDDSREALVTLRVCCNRLGIANLEIPFRDFGTFRTWWIDKGARGSWQARRSLLEDVFGKLAVSLDVLQMRRIERHIFQPLNSGGIVSWSQIKNEVDELRRHVSSSSSAADLRNIGNDCVSILEKLSEASYIHAIHGIGHEDEPPVAKTKIRLSSAVEHEYLAHSKKELKKLITATVDLAQAIKHDHRPSELETMVLAETVVFLIAMIDRILHSGQRNV